MEQIRNFIRKGKIKQAINKLLDNYPNSIYSNDLLLLSSQYQTNSRKNRLGIINTEKYDVIQNRIIYELLELTDAIEIKLAGKNDLQKSQTEIKKILFAEANPLEKNLFSNIEIREIETITSSNKSKFNLKIRFGLRLKNLIKILNEENPNIVHLSAFANDSGIYFHSKSDSPILEDNKTILSHLKLINTDIECFLFNTFISEKLAKEISTNHTLVIGFNGLIDSYDAIDFANGFYNTISYKKDYITAYKIGCQTISGESRLDSISKIFAYYNMEKVI